MSDKKIYTVGAVLLVVIVFLLIALSKVYQTREVVVPEEVRVAIEHSGWPIGVVPLLERSNMQMIKFGDELAIQQIDTGVSLEDFKSYLHELADAGFVADSFYGCQHPDMISDYITEDNRNEFTWIANTEDYKVIAIWRKEGTDKRIKNVYVELYDAVGPEYFEGKEWTYASPEYEDRVKEK